MVDVAQVALHVKTDFSVKPQYMITFVRCRLPLHYTDHCAGRNKRSREETLAMNGAVSHIHYRIRHYECLLIESSKNPGCILPDNAKYQSNGMDSSSPKRHLGARLVVLSTSQQRKGVHHEQA